MPSKGTTGQRGYDYQHQKLRKQVAPLVAAGKATCWRCSERIDPGQDWDLGHDDDDRTKYRGPEHAKAADCVMGGNRATAGRQAQVFTGPPGDTSRAW
jgi:hypothetical protein